MEKYASQCLHDPTGEKQTIQFFSKSANIRTSSPSLFGYSRIYWRIELSKCSRINWKIESSSMVSWGQIDAVLSTDNAADPQLSKHVRTFSYSRHDLISGLNPGLAGQWTGQRPIIEWRTKRSSNDHQIITWISHTETPQSCIKPLLFLYNYYHWWFTHSFHRLTIQTFIAIYFKFHGNNICLWGCISCFTLKLGVNFHALLNSMQHAHKFCSTVATSTYFGSD